jgi:hypothetical protein
MTRRNGHATLGVQQKLRNAAKNGSALVAVDRLAALVPIATNCRHAAPPPPAK